MTFMFTYISYPIFIQYSLCIEKVTLPMSSPKSKAPKAERIAIAADRIFGPMAVESVTLCSILEPKVTESLHSSLHSLFLKVSTCLNQPLCCIYASEALDGAPSGRAGASARRRIWRKAPETLAKTRWGAQYDGRYPT